MLNIIRNWVIKTMMKSKGETGIVKTIPKRDLVELNTQITAQRLMENGIDPNSLKNTDQVENAIIAIENRNQTMSIGEARGSGIRSTPEAKVFDMEGNEIPPGSRIMGGKEVKNTTGSLMSVPNKKGLAGMEYEIDEKSLKEGLMKTDNAFSDLVKTTEKGPKTLKEREAEVLARMNKENKEAARRIKNRKMVKDAVDNASPGFVKGDRKYNAQLVADDLAEKKFGKEYYDLDQTQQLDLYDEALEGYDELTRGMPDPEDFAQGGRAGFKTGLGKRFLELLKNKKMFRSKDDVPTSVFSEKTGPITIEDMANIPEDQLRKIRRTQELGLYTETPEILKAGNLFERFTKKVGGKRVIDYDRAEFILNRKLKGNETLNDLLQIEYQTRPGRADGGRIGFKDGPKKNMTRRTFLKLLGGLASIPIIGKIVKPIKLAKGVKNVPIIKTENVAGKPEWFDALVNKVIIEGDEVTKRFATGERQSIHQKTLDNGSVVRVTEDVDDGAVRVEYESVDNVYEDPVQLQYKKPLPDEGAPDPAAEFTTAETGPVGRADGPDDYSIDIEEVGGTSISDLTSDVSKLKEYATGKKPTMKEFIQNKKRKDRAKGISEGGENEMDEVIRRQGEFIEADLVDLDSPEFASGGIARMLGE